ncbi:MAG: DUF3048 domain-containing protein [Candidatus Riflebacteria bacterium]|nr:DUF3048 domain-containing protein [Candidatus Riflebacteria bacterium]
MNHRLFPTPPLRGLCRAIGGLILAALFAAAAGHAQELDDIRTYLALRDELSQVKAFLERGLTEEPGNGSLANPAVEGEILARLARLETAIEGVSRMPGPLASYYAERLQRLDADCRAMFPLFVQRLALSVRLVGNPQTASAPPAAPGLPVPSPAVAAPIAPVAPLPGQPSGQVPGTVPGLTAVPVPGPGVPAGAVPPVQPVPAPAGSPPQVAGGGQAVPLDRAQIARRREYFHPIGFRTLMDPRFGKAPPAGPMAGKTPAGPEPPPTGIAPALPLALPPAPGVPPVASAVAPVAPAGPVASLPAFVYPTLPKAADGMPVAIRPLEPWAGADPQVRESPGMRPLAVMIENHVQARPQTALDEAEVVYEIPVEGGITRFMALYYHVPGVIGPVRSCREYFVDRALEVNALYVHCGGSPAGYAYIGKSKVFAIDEISNGEPFFRDSTRKAPHNLYAKGQKLIDVMNRRHPMQLPYQRLPLLYGPIPTSPAIPNRGVAIRYHGNYTASFRFNGRYNLYDRFMNGLQHLDRVTLKPVSPGTIVVQEAAMRVIDDKGRQEISFLGQGRAFLLHGGTVAPITWRKDGVREFTRFFDEKGRPVVFSNKAPVWIQVVSPQNPVVFDPPLPQMARAPGGAVAAAPVSPGSPAPAAAAAAPASAPAVPPGAGGIPAPAASPGSGPGLPSPSAVTGAAPAPVTPVPTHIPAPPEEKTQ